jgi:membrane protein DedA with SNARE-associated domain
MLGGLEDLFGQLGSRALVPIFILIALDSSAFLGLVLPGETVALIAGAMAGAGMFTPWAAMGAVVGGAIVGDLAGYAFGRYKGVYLLQRWPFLGRHYERHRKTLESHFARWGAVTVLVGRFVAVGRAFTPFTAGLSKMPWRRFAPIAIVSGAIWGGIVASLGYLLGSNWQIVERWLKALGAGTVALIAMTILMVSFWRWLLKRQNEIEAAWQRHIATPFDRRYGPALNEVSAFVRARFSPGQYLSIHLTIGLILIGSLAWLFGGIVQDIFAQDPLVRVDRIITLFIEQRRTPTLDALMMVPGLLSDPRWLAALIATAAIALAAIGDAAMAIVAMLVLAGTFGLAFGLQAVFGALSPHVPAEAVVHGFEGFPNVAMASATATYGIFWYALAARTGSWRWQTVYAVVALYLIILIALGVLYQGRPLSAIAAGFALGGLWLAICVTGSVASGYLRIPAGAPVEDSEARIKHAP